MDCEYFLDTDLLRIHADELDVSAHMARLLCEEINQIRRMSDPEFNNRCTDLMTKAQGLADFYAEMARVVRNIGDDGDEVICRIHNLILDSRPDFSTVIRGEIMDL